MKENNFKCEAQTEQELRESTAPWSKTIEELVEYIQSLANRKHEYGTCVYATSLAATAAFQFVAGKLGITSYQASLADLDIIRRVRSIEGPFMIMEASRMLYPQYDLVRELADFQRESVPWIADAARRYLAASQDHVHPNVTERWEYWAAKHPTTATPEEAS